MEMQKGEQQEQTQAGLNLLPGWAFCAKVNSNCQVVFLTDRCRKEFMDLNLKVMEKNLQIYVKAEQVVSAKITMIKYFWNITFTNSDTFCDVACIIKQNKWKRQQ